VPQPFVPEQRKKQVVREARITWVVYVLVFLIAVLTDPWAPLLYWLGPYVLAQPLFRLYQLGEHGGAEHSDYTLLNTRTTISNPFMRWIAWNMPYHTEHHLYPGVPFHKLPRLHALVKHRLQTVSPGYLALNRDIWKGLAR
jgi:fatty acid desaturase